MSSWLNFIPPCLRNPQQITNVHDCLLGTSANDTNAIGPYWANLFFIIVAISSFLYLIYGGYLMLSAFGNESQFTKAKSVITSAVIGLVIATVASVLVNGFISLLTGGTIK